MGYYVRVLSTSADCVPLAELQSTLDEQHLAATLETNEDGDPDWEQAILCHVNGPEIAIIERNLITEGELGAEELAEFVDEIADCKPVSAVNWLNSFFPRVKCIYALQLLSGTDHQNGWEILGAVKNQIWSFAPAILQADSEGFTNEDGYHILWQFSDSVKGDWWMGMLVEGKWKHFQIELGNKGQREAFQQGRVPNGVKLA